MIDGRRVLALVPARGGSRGLPRKNVLPLGGRPLIAWTVEAALGCPLIDRVVLSTDDEEIAAAGRAAGCDVPFERPAPLATDTAATIDVALHALDALEAGGDAYDVLVLLQPTSPLRTSDDLTGALETLRSSGAPSVVSVVRSPVRPHWMFRHAPSEPLDPVVSEDERPARRQDQEGEYVVLNGAVYVTDVDELRRERRFVTTRTVGFPMPPERSVDVDTAADLARADALLADDARDPSA
ncbi:MAG: acylneuraminate cytidylyltransferase family protein [Planctomycetota bacterium]